jgi:glycosyltransferase involved in cell wall biosynthesis
MTKLDLVTIICPVFNEQECIPLFYRRIKTVFNSMSENIKYNIVFIDNNSTDNSVVLINDIISFDSAVYLIALTSNYGYQNSLICALNLCKGDVFVMIDVDCEDPPELISVFLNHYHDGFDVVYGERVSRQESQYLILLRKLYYRVVKYCADDCFNLDMAEFCLISNDVRLAVLSESNTFPFIRSSISRVGVHKAVPYTRGSRLSGISKYNLWGMTVFGIAGFFTSSTLPLRVGIYAIPFLFILIALVSIISTPVSHLTIYILLMILIIYSLFSLSFIAIYLARIYKNTLNRPKYFINRRKSILQDMN